MCGPVSCSQQVLLRSRADIVQASTDHAQQKTSESVCCSGDVDGVILSFSYLDMAVTITLHIFLLVVLNTLHSEI